MGSHGPNLAPMTPLLVVEDLHASVEGTDILEGVNLTVNPGEIHAIMGPNGSGKSTLANVLLGHPSYTVTQGTIIYKGKDVTAATPDELLAEASRHIARYKLPKQIVFSDHIVRSPAGKADYRWARDMVTRS